MPTEDIRNKSGENSNTDQKAEPRQSPTSEPSVHKFGGEPRTAPPKISVSRKPPGAKSAKKS